MHRVTAIEETLKKTNLDGWKKGGLVNLERSDADEWPAGWTFCTGTCGYDRQYAPKERNRMEVGNSNLRFPKKFGHLIIEKGSISLNGISLTIFDVKKKSFRVAIIPYTFEHTNIKNVSAGEKVNIEFDLIGKYINRQLPVQA